MRTVRARLSVLTLMLLVQQALALAVAGALVCCETTPPQATAQEECCEKAGEGHMCPVKHRRAPDGGCRMKSGCDTEASGVLAGAGFVYAAPLLSTFSIVAPHVQSNAWRVVAAAETLTSLPPATPPPKA